MSTKISYLYWRFPSQSLDYFFINQSLILEFLFIKQGYCVFVIHHHITFMCLLIFPTAIVSFIILPVKYPQLHIILFCFNFTT